MLRTTCRKMSMWRKPSKQSGSSTSLIDRLPFRKSKQATEQEQGVVSIDDPVEDLPSDSRQFKKRVCIEERRPYKPGDNVVSCIEVVSKQIYGNKDNWQETELSNRVHKFNLITRVMEELDHDVPNMSLHEMRTVGDVVKYFSTEVKDSSVLEDLSKLDLPKNLHMNMEYIRFNKDTDQIHGGITAFPGRPTIVSSLKYRKKYKGSDGGDVVNYPASIVGKN